MQVFLAQPHDEQTNENANLNWRSMIFMPVRFCNQALWCIIIALVLLAHPAHMELFSFDAVSCGFNLLHPFLIDCCMYDVEFVFEVLLGFV